MAEVVMKPLNEFENTAGETEGEKVFDVIAKNLDNLNLQISVSVVEDILRIKAVDVLTKSVYSNEFSLADISEMGSFALTEEAAFVLTKALQSAVPGNEITGLLMGFGYTTVGNEEKHHETTGLDVTEMFGRRSALRLKYEELETDPTCGDALVIKVDLQQEFFSHFFVYILPYQNTDEIPKRLLAMHQDRKNEIDHLKAEVEKLTVRVKQLEGDERKGGDVVESDGFLDSSILSYHTRCRLNAFLPKSERKRKLLWRASVDGESAEQFHARCDHEGPTVTIVKANGQIFGGYTPISWCSTEDGVSLKDRSNTSFLFNLTQNKRFNIKKDKNTECISCEESCGPTFGGLNGNDLRLGNNCLSKGNFCSPNRCSPNSFEGPGYSASSLAGIQSFAAKEVEIFTV